MYPRIQCLIGTGGDTQQIPMAASVLAPLKPTDANDVQFWRYFIDSQVLATVKTDASGRLGYYMAANVVFAFGYENYVRMVATTGGFDSAYLDHILPPADTALPLWKSPLRYFTPVGGVSHEFIFAGSFQRNNDGIPFEQEPAIIFWNVATYIVGADENDLLPPEEPFVPEPA